MDVRVVKYASRRSRIGDFSGDSSVRGARVRGVLASHASAGKGGCRLRELNRMEGVRGRDQAIGVGRMTGRAIGAVPGRTSRDG